MSGIEIRTGAGVLDSNILIYLSKGQLSFKTISDRYDAIYIPSIVYMEVLGFPFRDAEEESRLVNFLNTLPVYQTDMDIANLVIQYRKQSRIKLPDAIILATARKLGAELMTQNVNDFQNIDPKVPIVSPF
ncbi:type II toxin-antitoxin system VapC family toxin [Nibrella saemangeumensis]|uniref:Type II toxin-antitoxin system VapC family toxin n=1 Tax=Nibrella saemangeumensis TaxID=1084526 RepID=A0ABP8N0X5_9BACT